MVVLSICKIIEIAVVFPANLSQIKKSTKFVNKKNDIKEYTAISSHVKIHPDVETGMVVLRL